MTTLTSSPDYESKDSEDGLLTLALDMDSTLAATCDVAFDLLLGDNHDYGYDDIESWSWGIERFGQAAYLNALWHAWTLRPMEVPTMEPALWRKTQELAQKFKVDVVTKNADHMGIAEGKRKWLDQNAIAYSELHVLDANGNVSKSELGYDAYIDDSPHLPKRVNEDEPDAEVFLIDHEYNQDAAGDYVRVGNVGDVLDLTSGL